MRKLSDIEEMHDLIIDLIDKQATVYDFSSTANRWQNDSGMFVLDSGTRIAGKRYIPTTLGKIPGKQK